MADDQNPGIDETRTNGEGREAAPGDPSPDAAGEQGTAEQQEQLQELTKAYNRARDELNEAVRSVREELARVDFDQARRRAKSWVDENPTLAVFLGIGAGILTGRLISNAMHPTPPPLSERARRRAQILAREGGEYAGEFSTTLAKQIARALHEAGDAGAVAAKRGGEVAETVGRRARTFGDDVSHRAEKAGKDLSKRAEKAGKELSKRAERAGRDASFRARDFSESFTVRLDDITEALSDGASRSVKELEDAAHDLSKTMKKKSKHVKKSTTKNVERGIEYSDAMLNAARTVVAAAVIKKVNSWMKSMR